MRATRYKVGDTVRIRADLVAGKVYGDIKMSGLMAKFRGDNARVTAVPAVGIYRLDELFFWDEEMLESCETAG